MTQRLASANIDLHLVRVLHTVISERSVSRAALRLGSTQPQVSAQLRRLRQLTGDPLLVRAGTGLVPTDGALAMLAPAERLLSEADVLFATPRGAAAFEPARAQGCVRLAAADYLDPWFLPRVLSRVRREAPQLTIEIHPLSADSDYRRKLALGEIDLVIGNWLAPPDELHISPLLEDEVVCLVAQGHPAARQPRIWSAERYLEAEHLAPTPLHPGALGVIDEHLAHQGLSRRITVRAAHFSLAPLMVAHSSLVLTTGRLFCQRHLGDLPLRILRCPVDCPPLTYYQLWHERNHSAAPQRWLRDLVKQVAQGLPRVKSLS